MANSSPKDPAEHSAPMRSFPKVLPDLLRHNTRFRQRAAVLGSAHRRPPQGVRLRDSVVSGTGAPWETATSSPSLTAASLPLQAPCDAPTRRHPSRSASIWMAASVCITRVPALRGKAPASIPFRTRSRGMVEGVPHHDPDRRRHDLPRPCGGSRRDSHLEARCPRHRKADASAMPPPASRLTYHRGSGPADKGNRTLGGQGLRT
jgi:hypothetical protein